MNVSNFGIEGVQVKNDRVTLNIAGVATTFRFISPEEQAAKAARAAAAGEGPAKGK